MASLPRFCGLSTPRLGVATLGLLALAAGPLHAQTVLNFDNFTSAAASGPDFIGPTYSVQGFTLSSGSSLYAIAGTEQHGDGETSLASNDDYAVTLTQDNGAAFSLNAIDLGPVYGNYTGTLFAGPIVFTGTRADNTTVLATETITRSTYQTFTDFTGFTNLKSVTFQGTEAGSSIGSDPLFDNISVTANAPVPEASTTVSFGLLLALGMGGVIIAKKKKAAAPA